MRIFRFVLAASASVCFLMPARASDWYVDAANGNDANNGQSPASAWKTLTHAVLTVQPPTGGHTFHLAAGLYDAQNGEQYPLQVRNHMQIVGAGVDATILAGPASALLLYQSTTSTSGFPEPIQADTLASGMTLRSAAVGVELISDWNPVQPSLANLHFTALSTAAATLTVPNAFGSHVVMPSFTSVAIDSCGIGFALHSNAASSGAFSDVELSATDVEISGCAGDAFSIVSGGAGTFQSGSAAYADLVRCRAIQNGGAGVSLTGNSSLDAQSCLFAANTGAGVDASGGVGGAVALRNCTVANNGGVGLRGPTHAPTSIFGSILFGNATDIALVGAVSALDSCSGDGGLVGQPGCIQADPAFVNPAIGDYRLRFASPCIETGDPSANGQLDLFGHARPFDGDLDTHAAPDMGAFEFETLHRFGSTSLGQQFGLEFWGASGSSSRIFVSKQPLTPAQSTPFGDFFLAPGSVIDLGSVPAAPGPPHFLRRRIPNDPSFIGTTFSFQALTDSAAAPQGQAYTNPTSFVVLP